MKITMSSNVMVDFIKNSKVIKDDLGILIKTIDNNSIEIIKSDAKDQVKFTCIADVEEQGSIVIPSNIFNLIKKDKQMVINKNGIKLGNRSIELELTNNSYPDLKDNFEYNVFDLNDKQVKELLEVEHCLSKDITKPVLCGIYIKDNNFVAIDGYRMSVRKGNFTTEKPVIISNIKMLKGLKGNIKAIAGNKYIKYQINGYEYWNELIKGDFIDFEKLIPADDNYNTKMSIDKKTIEESLKDVASINKKDVNRFVILNIRENECTVKSSLCEIKMTDKLDCITDGDKLDINFNVKFLLDAIKDLKNIKANFINCVNPMTFIDDNKLELILPVRISHVA